jgi:hypothetical protein
MHLRRQHRPGAKKICLNHYNNYETAGLGGPEWHRMKRLPLVKIHHIIRRF